MFKYRTVRLVSLVLGLLTLSALAGASAPDLHLDKVFAATPIMGKVDGTALHLLPDRVFDGQAVKVDVKVDGSALRLTPARVFNGQAAAPGVVKNTGSKSLAATPDSGKGPDLTYGVMATTPNITKAPGALALAPSLPYTSPLGA